jgi:hypothetical protein
MIDSMLSLINVELYEIFTLWSIGMLIIFIIRHTVNCIIKSNQGDIVEFSIGIIAPLLLLNFAVYLIKF